MRRPVFLLLLGLTCSIQGGRYYRTRITRELSLLVSTDLVPVPPDELATKFISYRAPLAAYTNLNTDVEFGINTSVSRWRESDIELMKSFYKTNIINLYDEVEFLSEDIHLINRRNFIVFEYLSTLLPEEESVIHQAPIHKYTYVQYTIVRGTVYVFDFTSPPDQSSFWRPAVEKMMESVRIK